MTINGVTRFFISGMVYRLLKLSVFLLSFDFKRRLLTKCHKIVKNTFSTQDFNQNQHNEPE
jgi:hypothetical protein